MLKKIAGVVKIPSHVLRFSQVVLLPCWLFNMQFECPFSSPCPSCCFILQWVFNAEILAWHPFPYWYTAMAQTYNHIFSSGWSTSSCFNNGFLSLLPQLWNKSKGNTENDRPRKLVFYKCSLLSSLFQGDSPAAALENTLALTSDYSGGLGSPSIPVLGGDA